MSVSLLAFAALAAQVDPSMDCTNPISQSAMNMCAYQDYQAADRAMDAQWTLTVAAMRRFDRETTSEPNTAERPSYYNALLASQRAWLRYRDAQCLIDGYAARGGSMEPLLANNCLRRLTEGRTAQLRAIVEEGGG